MNIIALKRVFSLIFKSRLTMHVTISQSDQALGFKRTSNCPFQGIGRESNDTIAEL
jgi:hypothetical protein